MDIAVISQLVSGAEITKIEALEQHMLEHEQVEIPAIEDFSNGLYTREIIIPKDTLLTGRIWKHDYVDIMLSGDITVGTADGVKRLTGPNICDGSAGRKRAGYAHEDTHWITVHRVDQMEDDMEEHLSFFSMKEFNKWMDNQDFIRLAHEVGLTVAQIQEQSENESDRISIDVPAVYKDESNIAGEGLFAAEDINIGALICPSRMDGLRTEAGRYVNHSINPNCEMVLLNTGDIEMVAIKQIRTNDELTVNYRHVLSLQEAI